jgi:quinoprotein glucose dehydrogenase
MGTPYGVFSGPFLSPLNVPCTRPPFGLVSAIDLPSGKLIWTRTLGTARESGPWGIRSHLPLALGTLNFRGGVMVTQGGVFFTAAADRYFRAFDTRTGKLLWETPLPAGGTATPMSYTAPDGRQFVVITSGGSDGMHVTKGDFVAAYALPGVGSAP